MFTGLVQAVGTLTESIPTEAGRRLVIDPGEWGHSPNPGDSISVSGCCLTVVDVSEQGWSFDAIPETLAKTTLGGLEAGSRVNLEHAVTASTPMGGHFVQGHVDGVGRVARIETDDGWRVRVEPPADLMKFMIPKGSVTIDGVSLTLASMDPGAGWIEVALIPETLDRTTLRGLKTGDGVNLEADMLVKAVVHTTEAVLEARGG
ncbi:MAG: riboflavin synthase [Phycisphaerales bacterium JB040]